MGGRRVDLHVLKKGRFPELRLNENRLKGRLSENPKRLLGSEKGTEI